MKISDIENDVRLLLLDTEDDAYRFSPKEVFSAIRKAIVNTHSVRPESRYVNFLLVDFSFPNFSDPEFMRKSELTCIEDRWREAIVYYVAYSLYQKDDPDTQNLGLAKEYFARYSTAVMS